MKQDSTNIYYTEVKKDSLTNKKLINENGLKVDIIMGVVMIGFLIILFLSDKSLKR